LEFDNPELKIENKSEKKFR